MLFSRSFVTPAVGYLNTIVKSRMKPLIQSYERLALNADFARALKQYVRINSVRRVVQFDDGSVRYGIHAEFEGHDKINSFRIFKDEDTDAFDSYFYLVCDNKAELVDFKMNSLDIQLQAVFEKVTGIYLSH